MCLGKGNLARQPICATESHHRPKARPHDVSIHIVQDYELQKCNPLDQKSANEAAAKMSSAAGASQNNANGLEQYREIGLQRQFPQVGGVEPGPRREG